MVEYPDYMSQAHRWWIDGVVTDWDDADIVDTGGMTKAIKDAIADNPFTGLTGYDPTTDVTSMTSAITAFDTLINAIEPDDDYIDFANAAKTQIDTMYPVDDTYISARAAAHANILDNELDTKVYPRFEAGMRDINAVMTSAFAIGRAIIETDRNDKVDKFISDMEYQADTKRSDLISAATSEMIRLYLQKLEFERVIMAIGIDKARLAIAAQQDYKTEIKAIAADEGRWELECYKYGANLLAGIGGGTTPSVPVDGNKTARIIGTGLSGASAGAIIGSQIAGESGAGWGAMLGGIAGAIAGGS